MNDILDPTFLRTVPVSRFPVAGPNVPDAVARAGGAAVFVWEEFFGGTLRNRHTRAAYGRVIHSFLGWLEPHGVPLTQVTPGMVGNYLDQLESSIPSKKLALAALRRFFDALVLRHVVILNPAASVRGDRYQVDEGRTPEIAKDHARQLLASLPIHCLVGLRDRAILATLIYTAARAGAVAGLRIKDLAFDGTQHVLRFDEKGGKQRQIPVRHDLERYLLEYTRAAGLAHSPSATPLFRTALGRTDTLSDSPLSGTDVWRMVKRRLRSAGLPLVFSPHSFRVATLTDLLSQGVPEGDVQNLAGHADPRTTRLYDRRPKQVTRNLVERISI